MEFEVVVYKGVLIVFQLMFIGNSDFNYHDIPHRAENDCLFGISNLVYGMTAILITNTEEIVITVPGATYRRGSTFVGAGTPNSTNRSGRPR